MSSAKMRRASKRFLAALRRETRGEDRAADHWRDNSWITAVDFIPVTRETAAAVATIAALFPKETAA
jgi:hypothetical protein